MLRVAALRRAVARGAAEQRVRHARQRTLLRQGTQHPVERAGRFGPDREQRRLSYNRRQPRGQRLRPE